MTESDEYTFTATKIQFGPPYCDICGKSGLKFVVRDQPGYEFNLIDINNIKVCHDNIICIKKANLKIFL